MRDKLTQADIDKMQEEIDHRKLVVRKEALKALNEARAQGDLSENFEYYAAKQFKNQNESRIRYLENMIRTAIVVEDHSGQDEVGLEKRITVYFIDDDETEEYKMVTSVRGNSLKGLITGDSPLGAALMGHKTGETVRVKINEHAGYDVKILKVEDASDEEEQLRRF